MANFLPLYASTNTDMAKMHTHQPTTPNFLANPFSRPVLFPDLKCSFPIIDTIS